MKKIGIKSDARVIAKKAVMHQNTIFKVSLNFLMNDITPMELKIANEQFKLSDYAMKFRQLNHKLPTEKQFRFVKALFEGKSMTKAHRAAGYLQTGIAEQQWGRANMAYTSAGVQYLIGLILDRYVKRREVGARSLIEKAFETYDRCETATEQLQVLKFIAHMTGSYKKRPDVVST